MGARNLSRFTVDDWRAACPTVSLMRQARWEVVAVCPVCDLQFAVSLAVIEAVRGPGYSLWGRSCACVRRWCHGEALYFVQPPGATMEMRMTAAPTKKADDAR